MAGLVALYGQTKHKEAGKSGELRARLGQVGQIGASEVLTTA
jgi:hypothetical protein